MSRGLPMLRLPPRIKVLEAAGALGDGRVRVVRREERAISGIVRSSDGSRSYRVVVHVWDGGELGVYSSDNGTRLRGYVGYPIIALMMLHGLLPRSRRVEEALRGVPWREWNERYRRYSIVMDKAARLAEERGVPRSLLEEFVSSVMRAMSRYKFYYAEGLGGLDMFLLE